MVENGKPGHPYPFFEATRPRMSSLVTGRKDKTFPVFDQQVRAVAKYDREHSTVGGIALVCRVFFRYHRLV